MDEFELTGRARTHVQQFGAPLPRFAAQPAVARAFLAMRAAALADGIDLLPCASFRPLEGQLRIWNRKFSGQATLRDLDSGEQELVPLNSLAERLSRLA